MKIVQVAMPDADLDELSRLAQTLKVSRTELIRRACREYLQACKVAAMNAAYVAGYLKLPEDPSLGEAAETMAAERLERESS